jgi:hypothetical protein
MKALENITTLAEIKQYALAEAADAQRQCPAVYNNYLSAANTADAYATFAGTAIEISYVETARQQILAARQAWYDAGCTAPGTIVTGQTTAPPPVAPPVQAGLGGGGIGTLLLVGAGVFGLLYLLDKGRKGKGRKTSARRKSTRRAAPRRRRASRRRR